MTNSSRSTDKADQLRSNSDLNDTSIEGISGSNMTNSPGTLSTAGNGTGTNNSGTNPLSAFIESVKDQFVDIVDEQRMGRLQDCRIVEDVYKDCRRFNKLVKQQRQQQQQSSPTTGTTMNRTRHLEDVAPGIRILKYYDWRNMHEYDHNCSREKHAIWACRAGALQCGAELVQLRNCFNAAVIPPPGVTDPISSTNKNYGAVLSVSNTAYEPSKLKQSSTPSSINTIPCREFQEKMGLCIATNATALAEREMRRSEKSTTPS